MCGLCGEITFDDSPADPGALAAMAACMAPRGPDGQGIVTGGAVGLGHRRLKIIDLSEKAAQPMVDAELGLSIAFNGCIYNYKELRAELQEKGYRFFSNGDTEVVLKAHHAWGVEAPKHFHGMFAYAVTERDSGKLTLARDRFGIKPLYVAQCAGGKRLRFASSLPALLRAGEVDTSIDPVALAHYMTFHAVVPAPYTLLKGVRKLPPATVREIEPNGASRDHTYWALSFDRNPEDIEKSFADWQAEIGAALRLAVKRRMVADVPVGVLLSGGVDSSLIVALLAEGGQQGLKTFSIGFEAAKGESGDEFSYSDIVAQHFATDHQQIFVPSADLLDALPATIAAMSEPMVSYDNVGFFLLSREVAKSIKVVQSGQGADEVFAGYHWYPKVAQANDPLRAYAEAFFDRSHGALARHLNPDYLLEEDAPYRFVERHFNEPGAQEPVDKALRLDSTIMLVDDPVKRVDNMTMNWGLEARVPFLDHELVELAARMPGQHKLADGGKGVLKAVAREVVPQQVIDRPKGYFPVPALKYLDGPYLAMAQDALTSRAAKERGLFQTSYLDELFADPAAHITPLRGSELWQVALLELWLQQHGL